VERVKDVYLALWESCVVGRELHQIRHDATEGAVNLWLLRGEMEIRWGPANIRQRKKSDVRMREKIRKEKDARLSSCPEVWHGTFEIHCREGSEHWLTVLARVEMLIGERQSLPGLPLLRVFLHKLRLF